MIEYYDFDLPAAVTRGLRFLVRRNNPTELNGANLEKVRKACQDNKTNRGVYVICWGRLAMYVGKADALFHRLDQHQKKLSGRVGIPMNEIGFKAILLHKNWSTSANENLLIETLKKLGQCEWNGMGFGPKDTGGKRDDSKPSPFDLKYPINHEIQLVHLPNSISVPDLVKALKKDLPFLFRHDKSLSPPKKASTETPTVLSLPKSRKAWQLIKFLTTHLGETWQATRFPHKITLYPKKSAFDSALEIFP